MDNHQPILIVGLGNPGKEYAKTRHNIGFVTIDALREKLDFPDFKMEDQRSAEVSQGNLEQQKIILAKPQTFMNNSGQAVQALAAYYKVSPEDIWVIHDDLDLPVGSVKTRENGGSGGHNGIASITERLDTENYWRFKIGIGSPHDHTDSPRLRTTIGEGKEYVLGKFRLGERGKIKKAVNEIIKRIGDQLSS